MPTEESPPVRTTENTIVCFWEDAKQYGPAANPLFAQVLYIRVRVPGDKGNVEYEVETVYREGHPHPIHGKVKKNELIWAKYGKYIEEYKAHQGSPQALTGTPLERCAFINKATIYTLKHNGIHTAEDLAGLSDAGIAAIGMGGRKLAQDAKDYLAATAKSADVMAAAERERNLQSQIDGLRDQLAALGEAFDALPDDAQAVAKAALSKRGKRPQAA